MCAAMAVVFGFSMTVTYILKQSRGGGGIGKEDCDLWRLGQGRLFTKEGKQDLIVLIGQNSEAFGI